MVGRRRLTASLVAIQVPPEQHSQLDGFLEKLGYVYHRESDNPNYHQFFR